MIQEGSQEYKDACELWELFESQRKEMLGSASVPEMEEQFGFFLRFIFNCYYIMQFFREVKCKTWTLTIISSGVSSIGGDVVLSWEVSVRI